MDKKYPRLLFVLIGLVLLAGIVYSIHLGDNLRYHDEQDYYRLAANLVSHHFYSLDGERASLYRPPGYPLILALFLFLGANIVLLRILNFVALAGCLYLIYRLLERSVSARAGLLGTLFAAGYPVIFYTTGTLFPQILAAFIFLLALYLLSFEIAGNWSYPLSGLLLGWLVLMVPTFLYVPGLLLVWALLTGGLPRAKKYLVVVLTAGLVISLWTWRNFTVSGEIVPISTNSGFMLLLGNCENTTPNSGASADISYYRNEVCFLDLKEHQEDEYFRSKALEWIRGHKVEAVKLYIFKTLNYFNYRNNLYTKTEESASNDLLVLFTYGPLLLLFLGRIIYAKVVKLTALEILLIALYISSAFMHAVFFTRIRYRVPFDFLLIMIAAGFLERLWQRRKSRLISEPENHRKIEIS